ncbi:hypothetical protein [Maritalea sp.]|uniref:hypothetical protein n=1 Tax=Maritalea sp. TaxID=2003361 RepID=UPI003EF81D8C
MQRILILGCSGSGKTTLGKRLGDALGLPHIPMDRYFFNPNWVVKPRDEWAQIITQLVSEDEWVMDGNYSSSLDFRLVRADTAIFLDFPTWFCLYRVIRRTLTLFGKVRPGSSPGCPERFDREFYSYILNYNRRRRPKILKMLHAFPGETIVLSSAKDIDKFVTQVAKK